MTEANIVKLISEAMVVRVREFLENQLGVQVDAGQASGSEIDLVALHDITAIVGVGGAANLLVAFSLSSSLLDRIFERFTADIEVPPNERDTYRLETAAEFINIVVGHCTGDMPKGDHAITLSPPVVVQEAKSIHRAKGAVFWRQSIRTDQGDLDINYVGPRELFDIEMNYAA